MAGSHYETLGVRVSSTAEEIRSAYRRIVLEHHPDRSKDPKSPALFLAATAAYDVLGDAEARQRYDDLQRLERIKEEQAALKAYAERKNAATDNSRGSNSSRNRGRTPSVTPNVAPKGDAVPTAGRPRDGVDLRPGARGSSTIEVTRLSLLFSRGQFMEAERLARKLIEQDSRQPIPYAVLGDIHRQRGELSQASKMYAYAVQMDPRNSLYQQRYEELLGALNVRDGGRTEESNATQVIAPAVGAALVLVSGIYVVLSVEAPVMPGFRFVSSWTIGLIVMLFLSGVAIGGSFSIGHLLDRFSTVTTTTMGRLSPNIALVSIAIVNFWAAALFYVVLGFALGAFNFSTSRLIAAVAGGTFLMTLASAVTRGSLDGWQTLLWGGNVMYLGGLCGWMVADSFRR